MLYIVILKFEDKNYNVNDNNKYIVKLSVGMKILV